MVEQKALDASLPGLDDVLDRVIDGVFKAKTASPYEAEVKRAVESVLVERLIGVAANARMPQVRALVGDRLRGLGLGLAAASPDRAESAHSALLASEIQSFLSRPAASSALPALLTLPPGAPIGDPGMSYLYWAEPYCSEEGRR
jgi:hypothetical protein